MTKYGLRWFLGIRRKVQDHLSQKKFSSSESESFHPKPLCTQQFLCHWAIVSMTDEDDGIINDATWGYAVHDVMTTHDQTSSALEKNWNGFSPGLIFAVTFALPKYEETLCFGAEQTVISAAPAMVQAKAYYYLAIADVTLAITSLLLHLAPIEALHPITRAKQKCGIMPMRRGTFIVGGQPTGPSKYPWLAALLCKNCTRNHGPLPWRNSTNPWGHICGGNLISER